MIWSVERDPTVEPRPAVPVPDLTPVVSRLSAEIDSETVATGTLTRYPVASDVEVAEVREGGLVGVYYGPRQDDTVWASSYMADRWSSDCAATISGTP